MSMENGSEVVSTARRGELEPRDASVLTAEERAKFAEMRTRLAPAFQAIVDIEALLCGLSSREHEIMNMTLDGLSAADIAAKVGVSEYQIKLHHAQMYKKLGVTSRAALSAKLFRRS